MKIDCLVLGAYQTNCYILRSSDTAKDCLIVDAGLEAGELVEFLQRHKLNPAALVLTHGHVDHIAGLVELRKNFPDVKVYIHKLDAEMLTEAERNISTLTGLAFSTEPADFLIEEASLIEQAGLKMEVLHTPGHTQGGICLYARNEGIIFVGDTLFADSVGRTDFPSGSMSQLIKGIKEKLCVLPDETVVYPGHGPATTIVREKTHNQYLR
jgi:glyoxylase-like metal-dependent hydrolase (beta-lactamase superfamily II)